MINRGWCYKEILKENERGSTSEHLELVCKIKD